MTSGLCKVEMAVYNCVWFLCDICAVVKTYKQIIGGNFCVTSGLGRVEKQPNSCERFLCDIWAGQGGNIT